MLNSCTFIGNLGRDADIKEGTTKIASFSLAVTEKRKDKSGQYVPETTWVNFTAFGSTADVIEKYTTKGSKIYVDARYSESKYTAKDGTEKKSSKFLVNKVILLDSKQGGGRSQPNQHKPLYDDIPF